jgi:hypothetical protein
MLVGGQDANLLPNPFGGSDLPFFFRAGFLKKKRGEREREGKKEKKKKRVGGRL